MFNMLPKKVTPEMQRENDLHEAQMDLLKAEASLEYWEANAAMLRRRVKRLTTPACKANASGKESANVTRIAK